MEETIKPNEDEPEKRPINGEKIIEIKNRIKIGSNRILLNGSKNFSGILIDVGKEIFIKLFILYIFIKFGL